jgi:ribosome-associated toxin RatA of RatAB toxin-antitoxin module
MAALDGEATREIARADIELYAILADVERYPEWMRIARRAAVDERDADGRPARIELDLDAGVTTLRLGLRLRHDPPRRIDLAYERGDVKALDGAWELEPAGGDACRVTYRLRIDPGFKLGLLLRGPVADRVRAAVLDGALDDLARRASGSS